MKVYDYWMCANKHLDFCEEILNSSVYKSEKDSQELNNLIDIYYMLGYVFEGYTVCIAFTLDYRNEDGTPIKWDLNKDIECFDPVFSNASKIAYDASNKLGNTTTPYCINHHRFDRIVKEIIRTHLSASSHSDCPYLPYFATLDGVDSDQEFLLKNWSTDFRYNYSDNLLAGNKKTKYLDEEKRNKIINQLKEKITENNLRGLIKHCRKCQAAFGYFFKAPKPKEN